MHHSQFIYLETLILFYLPRAYVLVRNTADDVDKQLIHISSISDTVSPYRQDNDPVLLHRRTDRFSMNLDN